MALEPDLDLRRTQQHGPAPTDHTGALRRQQSTAYGSAVTVPRTRMAPEERREQLLDALLHLVATEGFAAVSMEAIARAGGIAKTVVYNAFGDVESALQALVAREQERVWEAITTAMPTLPVAGAPRTILLAALRSILDDVHRRGDSWRLILLPADGTPPALRAAVEAHRLRLVSQISPLVKWAMSLYETHGLDTELAAHMIIGNVEHTARLALMHPDAFTTERIIAFAEGVTAEIIGRVGTAPTRQRP